MSNILGFYLFLSSGKKRVLSDFLTAELVWRGWIKNGGSPPSSSTIDSVTSESLILKSEDDTFQIATKDFHKFYYLGFCLTIHASQGESFSDRYTIYDWYQLEPKAKYVAMSRGTNIQNIQIA